MSFFVWKKISPSDSGSPSPKNQQTTDQHQMSIVFFWEELSLLARQRRAPPPPQNGPGPRGLRRTRCPRTHSYSLLALSCLGVRAARCCLCSPGSSCRAGSRGLGSHWVAHACMGVATSSCVCAEAGCRGRSRRRPTRAPWSLGRRHHGRVSTFLTQKRVSTDTPPRSAGGNRGGFIYCV
jgi:hypothetical protein